MTFETMPHFARLLAKAAPFDPIPTAVIAPEEINSLGGALLGANHTIIKPILIGDKAKIEAAAKEPGADLSGIEIEHEVDHGEAAAKGVAMVHEGRAAAIMKGHLHTDELLRHIVKRDGGLRTDRRLTHVFVMDVPDFDRLIAITDGAMNILPDLKTKVHIAQNSIDLMQSLGVETPKVAVMSAVESVNDKIPSSVEAAELVKLAEDGQITGGVLGGPFALDNAVSVEAAKIKGIDHPVAGRADIMLMPTLEAGNIASKQLVYMAKSGIGGLVMGASCPVILTSRADDDDARLASCVMAALYGEWLKQR